MHEQTAEALLELYRHAVTLKLMPRAGWLQRGVAQPESVAEHSFGVALLALLAGDGAEGLDRGKILAIALLHDLAEATLGDLPASARRLFGAEAKHAAERRAMEELLAGLPQADYLALWDEYARGASSEARLVKGLDRIEMLVQALAYERAGSRALEEFWADAERGWGDEFPILREMALSLLAQRARLTGAAGHAPPDSR
ncbi:MAG TPA: HD domain-containing protein [Roseiflexaceae bacterium]|nr:HD domain-containing protein [Roseiflexaceae bacterium]